MRDYIFPPLLLPFFVLLVLLPFLAVFFVLSGSAVFQLVFDMSRNRALTVFSLAVIGSLINIPVYRMRGKPIERYYSFFGYIYAIRERRNIVVAVNVGGCVIPSILALKLIPELPLKAWFLSFAVCTAVIYMQAKPIKGVGIAVPMFIPPITAAIASYVSLSIFGCSILFLPKMAFSTGVLSSLFGADILHLKDLDRIGSGVVSIGGAGTFDGIFLTGLFAVIFSLFLV
jgi:uncharacterized membrane protein